MVRQFVKYNPAFLESEKLVGNFVVRQTDLQMIVKIVRENTAASNQHVLVIGPRGSGKTTLVRRVSAEIARDEALSSAWYPLVFAEESYNALSAADFWLESLFHLAEQTRDAQRMESYHELRRDPDEKRLAQRALGQLLDYADSIGKRILLVVENLDMLLSEFSSETEAWALRHTLMNEPRLMLLATATARFEAIDHPAKAMFEMFRIHDLRPLNDEECNTIWTLVTGAPLPGLQIRPIRILTGGNARLIALIARFGEKRSFRDLLENLIDLIDEHTDYFKSHLDNMAPMERKVYLALAELWKQSSAKEIAEVARLDVNTTSAYLKRLASKGKVVVENEGKRKKWYSISEGIYNIYYLMRRRGGPSARVKAAVRFMVGLYEPAAAAKLVLDESCTLKPEECRDHMMALAEIYRFAQDLQRFEIARTIPISVMESPYFDRSVREEIMAYNSSEKGLTDEVEEIIKALDRVFDLYRLKDYDAVLTLCRNLVVNYGEHQDVKILTLIAKVVLLQGLVLDQLGHFEQAITAYGEFIAKYGDRQEALIINLVAKAMYRKGVALRKLNRIDEEVLAYEELIAKYGGRQETVIVIQVAQAMLKRGFSLGKLNRNNESARACEEMIAKYGEQEEPQIVEVVAEAMLFKAMTLGGMCRIADAIVGFDDVLKTYSNRQEASVINVLLQAQLLKALALLGIEKQNEALTEIRSVINGHALSEDIVNLLNLVVIMFAALEDSKAILNILVDSPAAQQLETLIVGLQLYCGQEVRTAPEILEVAKDVVKRIEAHKRELEAPKE